MPRPALLALAALMTPTVLAQTSDFQLTDRGYFEHAGVSVMAFQDFYPDGHQGGAWRALEALADGRILFRPLN